MGKWNLKKNLWTELADLPLCCLGRKAAQASEQAVVDDAEVVPSGNLHWLSEGRHVWQPLPNISVFFTGSVACILMEMLGCPARMETAQWSVALIFLCLSFCYIPFDFA